MTQSIRMAYVVLHYNSIDDTLKCVETIQNTRAYSESEVVIVDNASPNGSGAKLQNLYRDDAHVRVILNPKNSGFSEGNNIGYRYIRENYDADFVTICNNDLEFPQEDYVERVERCYAEKKFHVLGPDVYNPHQKIHQSPLGMNSPTAFRAGLTWLFNALAELFFPVYWRLVGKKYAQSLKARKDTVPNWNERMDNVPLMGACLVFSSDFVKARENAFEPDTFLYYEEFLLYNECMRRGYSTLYLPDIQVIHHEGRSTNSTPGDERAKHRRWVHHFRHASGIYVRDLLKKGDPKKAVKRS